ncbi:MAG: tryptophan 7-halogenase [Pseudomarimonas sp.]
MRLPINAAEAPLRSVLVTGEPVHAWMIAARLARALRRHEVRVLVLEEDGEQTPGVLCFDPDIHAFHRTLGVEPSGVLRHLRATLRHGTHFADWSGRDQGGFVGFGSAGQLIERMPFQHYVTALRKQRGGARLVDYCPAAQAARAGKFALEGSGPLTGLEAGLSVERADYLNFLRALASDLDVGHVVGRLQQVECDADGHAQTLCLEDGRRVVADAYFDCTQDATLASAGGSPQRHPFPAQVGSVRRERRRARLPGPAPLFDQIVCREDGWERLRCVGDSVESERVWTVDPHSPGARQVANGLLRAPWQGRCVALGPALGDSVDLVADRWLLTRRAIAHWLRLLPTRDPPPKLRDEFNRVVVAEALRLADAQHLPLLTAAARTPGWAASVRIDEGAATDLRYRIDLFHSTGRLSFHEDEPLAAPRWMMLLEALGVLPKAADRLLPALPPEDLARRMDQVGTALAQAVAGLPSHDEALASLRQPAGISA